MSDMRADTVWTGARLATLIEGAPGPGVIENGILAAKDGLIVHVGTADDMPLRASRMVACGGRWITSGLTSLLLATNMAATLFRLTVEECLAGVTREAARALGLAGRIGALEAGKLCDLSIWDIETPGELVYAMGAMPLHARVRRGR